MTDHAKTLLFFIAVFLLAAVAYFYYAKNAEAPTPDSLPPADEDSAGEEWRTAAGAGYSFRYPASLGTSYIEALDWPPQAQVLPERFSCTKAGEATGRAGRTEPVAVSGREYCRTAIVEGAAGSTYTQYAYAFPDGADTVILTFSTRAPQCGNYDEPQMSACEAERQSLDIDALVDSMAATFTKTE